MLAALYWGSRKETLQTSLTCWQKTKILMAQAGLHDIVHDDVLQGVEANEDSPQTGFRYSLKSAGKLSEQLSLFVLSGAWASASNAVLLNVPDSGALSYKNRADHYLWTFAELIEIWDPLEGVVCQHDDLAWTGARLSASMPCVRRYQRTQA